MGEASVFFFVLFLFCFQNKHLVYFRYALNLRQSIK